MTAPITEADLKKAREVANDRLYPHVSEDGRVSLTNEDIDELAAALAQARADGEAAEREACARIIDEHMETVALQSHKRTLEPRHPGDLVGTAYAAAIRARGQTHD